MQVDKGLGKFVGACIFPVGIIFSSFCWRITFTGNNLVTIAFLDKQIPFKKVILNWIVVWSGNFGRSSRNSVLLLNAENISFYMNLLKMTNGG